MCMAYGIWCHRHTQHTRSSRRAHPPPVSHCSQVPSSLRSCPSFLPTQVPAGGACWEVGVSVLLLRSKVMLARWMGHMLLGMWEVPAVLFCCLSKCQGMYGAAAAGRHKACCCLTQAACSLPCACLPPARLPHDREARRWRKGRKEDGGEGGEERERREFPACHASMPAQHAKNAPKMQNVLFPDVFVSHVFLSVVCHVVFSWSLSLVSPDRKWETDDGHGLLEGRMDA